MSKNYKTNPGTGLTFQNLITSLVSCTEAIKTENPGFRYINPKCFIREKDTILFRTSEIAHDWQCISPEETGLVRESPDIRSGLYRLGIIFYWLAASRFPFQAKNVPDLVYAHVAKKAKPLDSVPQAFNLLVEKLLHKTPAERYQGYEGLLEDLRTIEENPAVKNFTPGRKDIPATLLFSSNLYGRRRELEALKDMLADTVRSKKIIFISGHPGIGKTSLVQHALKDFRGKDNTVVANGKFDLLKREAPYSGLIPVLKELVTSIVLKGEKEVGKLKNDMFRSCPNEIKYLTLLVAEFEKIVGKPEKELPPVLVKPVLETAIKGFLQVLSGKCRLLLFIDDVHWADNASLDLLTFIAQEESIRCTIVAAYREREINASFATKLHLLKESQLTEHVDPKPLSFDDLNNWVKDLTVMPDTETLKLATFLQSRTAGNPFYIKHLLRAMEERGILFYKPGGWQTDWGRAGKIRIAEDIATYIIEQVNNLSMEEQKILSVASVFSNSFELGHIQKLLPGFKIEEAIHRAEQKHLLLSTQVATDKTCYSFSHDSIRQVFYNLLEPEDKELMHYQAGKCLELSNASVFDITDQFNRAPFYFTNPEAKVLLAGYNLQAGISARKSAAYDAAYHYLSTAGQYVEAFSWKTHYSLKFEVLHAKAGAAYLNSKYGESEKIYRQILKIASPGMESIDIREQLVLVLIAKGNMREAVDYTLETLGLLGIHIPGQAGEADVQAGFAAVAQAIGERQPEELLDLPAMKDLEKEAAMRLIMYGTSAAYFVAQDVYPVLVLKQVEISVLYGNCEISSDAYTTYGLLLSAFAGDIPGGYAFGRLGIEIMKKYGAFHLESKACTMFNGFVQHVKDPVKNTIEPLKRGFVAGIETGDIEYACYCLTFLFIHQPFTPASFHTMIAEQEKWLDYMKKLKNNQTLEMAMPWHHLLQEISSFGFSKTEAEKYVSQLEKSGNAIAIAYGYIARLMASVFSRDFESALSYGGKVADYLEQIAGIHVVPVWQFYYGVALATTNSRPELLEEFISNLNHKAVYAPENYKHKALLLTALSSKDSPEVISILEAAVSMAEKSGIWIEAGLTYEIYSDILLKSGNTIQTSGALLKSLKYYSNIGADKKLPELSVSLKEVAGLDGQMNDFYPGIFYKELYKDIFNEISLKPLVRKLLHIILKGSGADMCALIINKPEPYLIGTITELKYSETDKKLSLYKNLPESFIRYANFSGEELLWRKGDTAVKNFKMGEHVTSAIARPLNIEGNNIGTIYMESGQSAVFTDKSLDMLRMLSQQVAISINNALLYDTLKNKEASMTKLMEEKEQLLTALAGEKKRTVAGIIAAEEKEKQRLARELHDNTGQQIAALKMQLQNLGASDMTKLRSLQQLADNISENIRNISHSMMPASLEQLGLAPAIQDLLDFSFRNSPVKAEFDYFGPEKRFLPVLEKNLYRITQELITNIIKHACATWVYVQIVLNNKMLILRIEDNGKGMGNEIKGIGLSNINYRLQAFDGEISFENLTPSGTQISIKVPFYETN